MCKLKVISAFIILIFMSLNPLKSQNNFGQRALVINYNYENVLRFEFPININAYRKKDYYYEIERVKDFVPIILANIQEIGYEAQTNLPLDIDIVKLKNTALMHVYRNKRPVTYHLKDSTLLFHGFHKMRLVEAGQPDVFLYFDKEEDLKNLLLMDFDTIKTNILQQIKIQKISHYKIVNSTDLFFTQVENKILYSGNLGYTQKYRLVGNVGFGAASIYDKIGGSIYCGLGLGRFSINNYGERFQKSNFRLEIHSMFFNNLVGSKVGLNYINSNFKNNFSMGLGGGIYGIGNPSGGQPFQEGLFISHLIEKNNFRFSLDYLFNSDFFKNKDVDIPILLTVGFQF